MHRVFQLFLIVLLFSPATQALSETPLTIPGATTINSAQAKELFDQKILFIDVRSPGRFAPGHVPNAVNLESVNAFNKKSLSKHLAPETPFVVYCDGIHCGRSVDAAYKAIAWGFTNIYFFRDGYPAWEKSGFPIEKAKGASNTKPSQNPIQPES